MQFAGWIVAVSIACTTLMGCNATTGKSVGSDMQAEAVWAALEAGGKVVLFRHGETERGAGSGDPLVRDGSCRRERNLSHNGQRQFTRVGEAFATRGIHVDQVFTSPYCRARNSGEIAFGAVEAREFLALSEALPDAVAEDAALDAADLIGNYDGEGNLVLITHEPNIVLITQQRVGVAEALVLEPEGGPFFRVIGSLRF
jgi:phosphohistidine phosphatase SixA/predicted small secreted protein